MKDYNLLLLDEFFLHQERVRLRRAEVRLSKATEVLQGAVEWCWNTKRRKKGNLEWGNLLFLREECGNFGTSTFSLFILFCWGGDILPAA